ncbi:MAG TPA: hypothetical protein O0W90_03135 [Methanocorpusculum sp.]|nr:hypothetical protein [Methanocorpusculum sp.]
MDKTGLITLIVGILLLAAGIFGIVFFFEEFLYVLTGGFGIVLALIGLGAVFLGILMLKE